MDQRGGCGTQTRRVMTGAQKTNYHSETHGLPKALMHVSWSLCSHFVQSLDLKKENKTVVEILSFVLGAPGSLRRSSMHGSSILVLCPLKFCTAGDKISREFYCLIVIFLRSA